LRAQRQAYEFYDFEALISGGQYIKTGTLTDFLCERPECGELKGLLCECNGTVNAFGAMIDLAKRLEGFKPSCGISNFGPYRDAWEFIQEKKNDSDAAQSVAAQASQLSDLIRYALTPLRVNLSAFGRDDPVRAWYAEQIRQSCQ